MNRSLARILQLLVVLAGLAAAAFLLWEPQLEGRNINATQFQIYFNDPFLAFAYVGSIAFFVGAWRVFQLLGYARQERFQSPEAAKALRSLKHCAFAIIGFVAIGEVAILLRDSDDRAGGVAMGVLIALASTAVATAATLIQRALRNRAHA